MLGIGQMNIITKRLLEVVVAICLLLGATSCTYSFSMKASGSLDKSILFQFFKSANDERPSKFDITGFTVQEQKDNSQWSVIWHLNGRESLSSIEYGRKYKGLAEVVPYKSLSAGRQYRAVVSGSVWPDPGQGHAGIEFFFDQDGYLIQGSVK